ncbi:hypothetical protein ACWDXV_32360 [Nocardia nova]
MWQRAVGSEVEQAFFLGVELLEPSGKRGVHGTDARLFVGQRFIQQSADGRVEVGGEVESGVVVDDGAFDLLGRNVGHVAVVVLPPSAKEVAIEAAVAPSGFGVDEA